MDRLIVTHIFPENFLSGLSYHTLVWWLIDAFCHICWTSLGIYVTSSEFCGYVWVCVLVNVCVCVCVCERERERGSLRDRQTKDTKDGGKRNTSDSGIFLIYCIFWPNASRFSLLPAYLEQLIFFTILFVLSFAIILREGGMLRSSWPTYSFPTNNIFHTNNNNM